MSLRTLCLGAVAWCGTAMAVGRAGEPAVIPPTVRSILDQKCVACHDGQGAEGDVRLDAAAIDWDHAAEVDLWRRVAEVIEDGRMPPPEEVPATALERETISGFLDPPLTAHTPFGGGQPRRLSRKEYESTVRRLVHLPSFMLPVGFPQDAERHGFNNLADGLVLSPAHLEAYANVARDVADEIFPAPRAAPLAVRYEAGPRDLVLSFSAATLHGDALRLVSRSVDIMRSCTWPSRIEVKDSGTYSITVEASTFLADEGHRFDGPMKLEVYARPVSATDRSTVAAFRLLHTIDVAHESPATTTFDADLYEGDTVLFRWANAEMTHEFNELADQMEAWFRADPRFLAAWQLAVFPSGDLDKPETGRLRGRNGWDVVVRSSSASGTTASRRRSRSRRARR